MHSSASLLLLHMFECCATSCVKPPLYGAGEGERRGCAGGGQRAPHGERPLQAARRAWCFPCSQPALQSLSRSMLCLSSRCVLATSPQALAERLQVGHAHALAVMDMQSHGRPRPCLLHCCSAITRSPVSSHCHQGHQDRRALRAHAEQCRSMRRRLAAAAGAGECGHSGGAHLRDGRHRGPMRCAAPVPGALSLFFPHQAMPSCNVSTGEQPARSGSWLSSTQLCVMLHVLMHYLTRVQTTFNLLNISGHHMLLRKRAASTVLDSLCTNSSLPCLWVLRPAHTCACTWRTCMSSGAHACRTTSSRRCERGMHGSCCRTPAHSGGRAASVARCRPALSLLWRAFWRAIELGCAAPAAGQCAALTGGVQRINGQQRSLQACGQAYLIRGSCHSLCSRQERPAGPTEFSDGGAGSLDPQILQLRAACKTPQARACLAMHPDCPLRAMSCACALLQQSSCRFGTRAQGC